MNNNHNNKKESKMNTYKVLIFETGEVCEMQAETKVQLTLQLKLKGIGAKIVNSEETKEETVNKFTIAGTGTRQLINEPKEYRHKVLNYLVELLEEAKKKHGAENIQVISGMAEGFDEALARASVIAGVPFIAAVPNAGYINYYWGTPDSNKKTKGSRTGSSRINTGLELLSKAVEVVNVCKSLYGEDGRHANFIRNEWMADRADVVWVYNPSNSPGTAQCVNYCKEKDIKMFNIVVSKDDENNGGDNPISTPSNPQGGNEMNTPLSIEKLEKLSPETVAEIRAKLEEKILPKLEADVSNYAKGRMRTWMPYFAPLDSKNNMNQPFMPGILDDEIWQWIVDLCAKHGFKADTCLISMGGNIGPHRDTTYAAAWAFGINLGVCNWHIASNRDSAKTDYTMSLTGGEVFKFNSKHTHAVTDAAPDRWAINVWAIADTNAAKNARIHERLEEMMNNNPEVQEFVDFHQPGANSTHSKEETLMKIETNNNSYKEIQEKTMKKKNVTIKNWTFNEQLVQLKKTDDPVRIENNQSFYFVVNGNVNYPTKGEGIMNEEMAISWAVEKGWAEKPEQNKKEEIVNNNETVLDTNINNNGIVLNAKQQEAYDAIVNGTENILLTGNAGTGKSFLTKLFVEALKSQGHKTLVTATTGIAATHIEGRTYHSALRILPKNDIALFADLVTATVIDMNKMRGFVNQLKTVHTIVVDEVSMMHPREFARIDKALRQVLNKEDVPFGGIRFVFVGDFLQIEPVEKDKNNAKYTYAFQTKAWHEAAIRTIQLTEVVRQQDAVFAAFLNNLRQGIWTSRMERIIESRKVTKETVLPEGVVHFMSKNKMVDSINEQKLSEIDGETFTFEAKDANPGFYVAGGVWKENKDYWNNNCLAPQTLNLKIGAQVMCLINDVDGTYVNGDTGIVVAVHRKIVTVHIHRTNCQMNFEAHTFHQQDLAPKQEPTEYRRQIPLKLSWAVTIHKSQGMTLDSAIIYADDIFAAGQMYVALSRVRSLDGLFIKSFDSSKVFADDNALKFYGLTGNLTGPAAESVCRMKALEEQGPDDTNNNGGTMIPTPKPSNNNDGGNSIETPKEETMENTTQEILVEQIKALIKQQAEAVGPTKKEEGYMEIKEYYVSTASLANPTATVYARVITNDPDYWFAKDQTVVHEVIDRGGYHFALLEELFGGLSFCVNISEINKENILATRLIRKPEDIIFGYADFDAETMIRVKGYKNDQYSTLAEYGLVVGNSAKMTKRLVELTKAVRGYAIHKAGAKKLRIKILTFEQMLAAFPYLKTLDKAGKPADGISLLAVETAKYVYRANTHASKSSKAKVLREIEEKKVTNHTIRVLTNIDGIAGLVKGNALTAPRKQINSRMAELGFIGKDETYDIFTSVDNWKTELGTDGSFELITLEPHHEPGIVKTNDQTLGQYFGMPGMFDPKEMIETFQIAMDKIYNDMVEGNDIKMLDNVQALKPRTEAEKIAGIESSKVSNQVNKMAATLKGLDLGIGVSQTLMLQRANLINKMFLSELMPEGMNWAAQAKEKKSFLFMPWSYRAYIMAKEVVHMLGYDVDLNNMEAQYHPETQTIMVPGSMYDEIMAKLGGGDADDEVMVHIRKMICKDGSTRLVAVLIRTPNDWGEYWIIDVDIDNMGPVFFAEEDGIEMPTIYEQDFDKFKVTPICDKLPSVKDGSFRPNGLIWDWESTRYNVHTAQFKGQSVGGQVKTKMIHYSTFDAPFTELPCANEDMIDALQQCKGSDEDLIALNNWASEAIADVVAGAKMDAYWWFSRNMSKTVKALATTKHLHGNQGHLAPHESPIVTELMAPRERIVRETYSRMLNWLNHNVVEIPELNICIHKDNQMKFRKLVTELNKEFLIPQSMVFDEFGGKRKITKAERSKHFESAALAVSTRFANYKARLNDDVQFNKFVLSLVRMSWIMKSEAVAKSYDMKNPRHNYDRWLYTAVSEADTIMTDYFFDAMLWFREAYKNKN